MGSGVGFLVKNTTYFIFGVFKVIANCFTKHYNLNRNLNSEVLFPITLLVLRGEVAVFC